MAHVFLPASPAEDTESRLAPVSWEGSFLLRRRYPTELSAVVEMFSMDTLPSIETAGLMWLLDTGQAGSETEELYIYIFHFKCNQFNVNSHTLLMAIIRTAE